MHDDIFDSNKFELIAETSNENGINRLTISPIADSFRCTNCMSSNIVKKENSSHKVLDVNDNKIVEVEVVQNRYRCKDCTHTFLLNTTSIYDTKIHMTSDFIEYIAEDMLSRSTTSYNKATEFYGVSRTTIATAMQKYEQKLDKEQIKIVNCSLLILLPFEYEKKMRCCVCGRVEENKKILNVAFGFIEDYKPKNIEKFLIEKVIDKESVFTVVCPPLSLEIINVIKEVFPETEVVLNLNDLENSINLLVPYEDDSLWSQKLTAKNEYLKICKNSKKVDNFKKDLSAWFDKLPVDFQSLFKSVYDNSINSANEICSAYMYEKEEFDISLIQGVVEYFKSNHIPYEIMVLRTIFMNPAVHRPILNSMSANYMANMLSYNFLNPNYQSGYYVQIEKLSKLFFE